MERYEVADSGELYEQLGTHLQRGAHEDSTARNQLAELRHAHTFKAVYALNRLQEDVDFVKGDQNGFHYITGGSITAVSLLTSREDLYVESHVVRYSADPVDEHPGQPHQEFDGKNPKAATEGGLGFEDNDKANQFEELTAES